MGKYVLRFFPNFSKIMGNFGILSYIFLIETHGAYTMAEKIGGSISYLATRER